MSARPRRPAEPPPLRGTVLFVHGLWLTGAESFFIRRRLAARGWSMRALPYSSMAESMDIVARRGARFAHALARRTLQPVHLVGHSLGGLIAYGTDFDAYFRRAATFVDKILTGTRPAELPIEQPTTFELVVNLTTAEALGVTIPPAILLRADRIIGR